MRILEREISKFQKFGINLGLERIKYLLEKLDNPHQKFKSIHVAGTNGKGSVCAMLSSILKEAGYKVGMYTSPHLHKYNERIQIRGQVIGDREIEKYFKLIKPHAKEVQATIFEILTAMAFKYFADKKVDIAVVEVGMGGRFDATNVLTPEVSVITNIDFDHCEYLGNTLAKIAFEKAGIIKPGVPVITAEHKKEALRVLGPVISCRTRNDLRVPLHGPHQKQNAAVAVKTAELLGISKKAIKAGLAKTKWPGRFQIVSKKPLVIVDCAHNVAGIKALKETLKEQKIKTPLNIVFGVQKYKNVDAMIKELLPIAKKIIAAQSSHPQALPAEELAEKIPKNKLAAEHDNGPRLICGSLFLAADMI